ALAIATHAAYEWVAHPDIFGWIMVALLVVSRTSPRVSRRFYDRRAARGGKSRSHTAASEKMVGSSPARPTSCKPTGKPDTGAHGTLIEGSPARLAGSVHTSERYMARGSFVFSPSANAVVGDVGHAIASTR